MNQTKINAAVSRWTDENARPLFRGRLISEDGCCCAQGDVLRHECSISDDALREMRQSVADRKVADALGISLMHSILLRTINDTGSGCPQDVLVAPEKVFGPHAQALLAFGRHMERMDGKMWTVARDAAGDAAGVAAWDAAGLAARVAAGEIIGYDKLIADGHKPYFLPMFGFNSPQDILDNDTDNTPRP